jgi:hypothetical protein
MNQINLRPRLVWPHPSYYNWIAQKAYQMTQPYAIQFQLYKFKLLSTRPSMQYISDNEPNQNKSTTRTSNHFDLLDRITNKTKGTSGDFERERE